MALLGTWLLRLAFASAVAAAALLLLTARSPGGGRPRARSLAALERLGRNLSVVTAASAISASALLVTALLRDDFRLAYVASNSSRLMPPVYKLSAWWSGQEGSLLLWLTMLSALAAYLALLAPVRAQRYVPAALATLMGLASFFGALVAFVESPFRLLPQPPVDGAGMNPLLQNPAMLLHPLFLYGGYVGFSVPFAFAVAALAHRDAGPDWLYLTRRWALGAWLSLSAGILAGAQWSYVELGWGGYWGWDPVENSSLMPWLVATAFIHSAMVQERRGILKNWNVGLIFATFWLTILGTLITRSGILSSVHSFVESPVGPWFIGLLGVLAAGCLSLTASRWEVVTSVRRIESPASREAAFLANNLVLAGTAFAVFWGTIFPLITRLFGVEMTVGAPFYRQTAGPLLLVLVALMGIGPAAAWRRGDWERLGHHLAMPGLIGTAAAAAALLLMRRPGIGAYLAVGAAAFAASATVAEVLRAAAARKRRFGEDWPRAVWRLARANPRRYGGYLVHLGVALIAIGIMGSQFLAVEGRAGLALGESTAVGPYSLRLVGIDEEVERGIPGVHATIEVSDRQTGRVLGALRPEKRFFPGFAEQDGPTTEVAVWSRPSSDLYVVLAGWDDEQITAGLEFKVLPLVWWIWIGGYLLIAGTLFALLPGGRAGRWREDGWLAELSEMELDLLTGKLAEADYAALRAAVLQEAAVSSEQWELRRQRTRERLEEELRRAAGAPEAGRWRKVAGGLPMGAFLLAAAVGALLLAMLGLPAMRAKAGAAGQAVAPGIARTVTQRVAPTVTQPGAQTGTSLNPLEAGSADRALVIEQEVLVVRREASAALRLLDLVTVANPGRAAVDVTALPLLSGADRLELGEGFDPSTTDLETDRILDRRPLAPGEIRRYAFSYSVVAPRLPVTLSRQRLHQVRALTVLVADAELDLAGSGLRQGPSQSLGERPLKAWYAEDLEPADDAWLLAVRNRSAVASEGSLPVLAGHDSAMRQMWAPLVYGAVAAFGTLVWVRTRSSWERRRWVRRLTSDLASGEGDPLEPADLEGLDLRALQRLRRQLLAAAVEQEQRKPGDRSDPRRERLMDALVTVDLLLDPGLAGPVTGEGA